MPAFTNEVVLITGAASGIGREFARQLLESGARVGGLDIQGQALKALELELNRPNFAWTAVDVMDRPSLISAVQRLEEQLGPVDRLIVCAGVLRFTPAVTFDAHEFEVNIQVNLLGAANAVAAVIPGMVARKKGHVAALSSLASFRGLQSVAGYSASKAGLNAMLDSLRVELRQHGIAVTTICPGYIETPMTAIRTCKLMKVDQAVRRMLHAISRRRRFVSFPMHQSLALQAICWLPTFWSDWFTARFIH
jgi:NAD(P)-dependent dehydrogenase (short-subunit alcohol dehydrogenase family)